MYISINIILILYCNVTFQQRWRLETTTFPNAFYSLQAKVVGQLLFAESKGKDSVWWLWLGFGMPLLSGNLWSLKVFSCLALYSPCFYLGKLGFLQIQVFNWSWSGQVLIQHYGRQGPNSPPQEATTKQHHRNSFLTKPRSFKSAWCRPNQ